MNKPKVRLIGNKYYQKIQESKGYYKVSITPYYTDSLISVNCNDGRGQLYMISGSTDIKYCFGFEKRLVIVIEWKEFK